MIIIICAYYVRTRDGCDVWFTSTVYVIIIIICVYYVSTRHVCDSKEMSGSHEQYMYVQRHPKTSLSVTPIHTV